ncbi:hypothetical protein [Nautilia sp.]
MNAKDFFEKYSIETINKKTRISPISLKYIKNRNFKKIPRVKFLGFIRIIEKEFNVDLSDLIEEYNLETNHIHKEQTSEVLKEPKKHNTLILSILTLILFSLGGYILYTDYTAKSRTSFEINNSTYLPAEENKTLIQPEKKEIPEEYNNSYSHSQNETKKTVAEINTTETKTAAKTYPKTVYIIPKEQVWFKALNLDTNKSVEFLTSHEKTLEGTNWYIKFGHGNVTVIYGNSTIAPDTKKIVRLLLKNGKYEYLKKPNRYEK